MLRKQLCQPVLIEVAKNTQVLSDMEMGCWQIFDS